MIKPEKTTSILTKELETLTDMQLHDLFTFFYKLNHQYGNVITDEKFAYKAKTSIPCMRSKTNVFSLIIF